MSGLPRKWGRLGRSVPRPLLVLLAAVLVTSFAWAALVPAWQAPDEAAHYDYVATLAERGELPGGLEHQFFSTEQQLAARAVNADQTAGVEKTKPEWSERAFAAWQREQARLPEEAAADGGGFNTASANPPTYYLYDSLAYRATSSGTVFDRLLAMRVASGLLLLITVVGAWLLAGEAFGRNRSLQLVTAAVAGLFPMVTFISSTVTPDALVFATWTLVLWLGVRVIRRGATPWSAAGLGAMTALAIVSKSTSYALVPAVLFALAVGVWRVRDLPRGRVLAIAGVGLAALAVPVVAWIGIAGALDRAAVNAIPESSERPFIWREVFSYLWQYYLPRLDFQNEFAFHYMDFPLFDVWIKQTWGSYGWLETQFPQAVYFVFAGLTLLIVIGGFAALARRRSATTALGVAFVALVAVALLAGLHWSEYHHYIASGRSQIQGRYLLPLVALFGLGLAGGLSLLPARARAAGIGVVLAGLVVLQLFSFGLVTGRFYA